MARLQGTASGSCCSILAHAFYPAWVQYGEAEPLEELATHSSSLAFFLNEDPPITLTLQAASTERGQSGFRSTRGSFKILTKFQDESGLVIECKSGESSRRLANALPTLIEICSVARP